MRFLNSALSFRICYFNSRASLKESPGLRTLVAAATLVLSWRIREIWLTSCDRRTKMAPWSISRYSLPVQKQADLSMSGVIQISTSCQQRLEGMARRSILCTLSHAQTVPLNHSQDGVGSWAVAAPNDYSTSMS